MHNPSESGNAFPTRDPALLEGGSSFDRSRPRQAAVLLLAYPRRGVPHVVFTKRTETVREHRGQISLPGGSVDPSDESLEATALREAEEEIGLRRADVNILGRLNDVHVYVSNFMIAPIVAAADFEPRFRADPSEVGEIIEVPLQTLRDPGIYREDEWLIGGELRAVQIYEYGPHQIWGATARVVELFLASDYAAVLAEESRWKKG